MNSFGRYLRISIMGESHGAGIGLLMDGVPPGLEIDEAAMQARMDERRPGQNKLTTQRGEADRVQIKTGVFQGKTTGAPVLLWIDNADTRSKDYSELQHKPRPGHSDWIAHAWSQGHNDHRGGGHYSGRLTACLVAGAALIAPLLQKQGIHVGAHLHSIAGFDGHDGGPVHHEGVHAGPADVAKANEAVQASQVKTAHVELEDAFVAAIDAARKAGDSLGATIAWQAEGIPEAWGDPFFDSIESQLAHMFLAIPAVKAVGFGAGVRAAAMQGSEHNDAITPKGTRTNWSGGILGGRSTGMPLWGHVSIKPTSSIFHAQDTIDLRTGEPTRLELKGRHDPCIGIRAVPVVRAAAELVLADFLLQARMEGHA